MGVFEDVVQRLFHDHEQVVSHLGGQRKRRDLRGQIQMAGYRRWLEKVVRIEVASMDGHASSVRLRQLWTLDWHNNWVAPATLPAPK